MKKTIALLSTVFLSLGAVVASDLEGSSDDGGMGDAGRQMMSGATEVTGRVAEEHGRFQAQFLQVLVNGKPLKGCDCGNPSCTNTSSRLRLTVSVGATDELSASAAAALKVHPSFLRQFDADSLGAVRLERQNVVSGEFSEVPASMVPSELSFNGLQLVVTATEREGYAQAQAATQVAELMMALEMLGGRLSMSGVGGLSASPSGVRVMSVNDLLVLSMLLGGMMSRATAEGMPVEVGESGPDTVE